MGLFGKKSSAEPTKVKRDLRKARRFFEHAQTVADARNYDYAIECYINGLRHEPDNMDAHEQLRDVARRRKVGGGKPASFSEKLSLGRKDPVEKFLHAEMLWSKDPLNLQLMVETMARAVDAHEDEPDLNIGEFAYWIGTLILDQGETDRPPAKKDLVAIRDLFARLGAFDRAVTACRLALQLDETDARLQADLDDLEAERTMQEGGYGQDSAGDVDFRKSIRNKDAQAALDQEDMLSKTDQAKDEIIARAREMFQQKPGDIDARSKLVKALLDKGDDTHDQEAYKLLKEAYETTKQYQHKMAMSDVQLRRVNRQLASLRAKAATDPKAAEQHKELSRKKLRFELADFAERVKHYPTERRWRHELGQRLVAVGKYEEAVSMFQHAKADPRYRASSYVMLGRCYVEMDWLDLAIETLQEGLTQHPSQEDKLGLELRYTLLDAFMRSATQLQTDDPEKARTQLQEAQKIANQIVQVDINYRDIKKRLDDIRQLGKATASSA